jgi:hypothetical protein
MSLTARNLVGLLLGCLAVAVCGCARWTTTSPSSAALKLPLPRMSADSVVFEVAFALLPPEDEPLDREIWAEIDEQHLPVETRRRLAANGFRSGLVGSPLPVGLQRLLDDQQNNAAVRLNNGEPVLDELTMQQRKQLGAGRKGDVVTSQTLDKISVLRLQEGRLVGQTYEQAQCHFVVRSFPQGDGRVRLELTPEIHHGPIRQHYVGDERALRLDASKGREEFVDLRLETTLSPGQSLVVACTPELKGLGRSFFAEADGANVQRRILLIRLVQTQLDDRFQSGAAAAPLITPAE